MSGSQRLRVALVLSDLHGGGAQRVVLRLLEELDRRRFEPLLIVFENTGRFRGSVPADVAVTDCGRYGTGGRIAWFRRLVGLFRSEPLDLVASFLWFTNAICLLARSLSGGEVPLLVSERVSVEGARERWLDDLARALAIRLLYSDADCLLTNSEAMADQLARAAEIPRTRVRSLPNPIDLRRIRALARRDPVPRPSDLPLVIGMGRLVPQKGFDLAVQAMALASTPFRLRLLGEGPGLASLMALARELGVAERLELPGFVDNPFRELAAADLFVLPSRFEGFPNALVEAMALGVPSIAARCPTGPEEIVGQGESGVLVPVADAKALAGAIQALLRDPRERARLGQGAARRAEDFDAVRVVRSYEELFAQVAG